MELTGRLTADAEIKKTTDNRQLVAFTVAVNDYFKTKSGEPKELTEFFNCSYWLSTKIADSLLKGSIVTVTGRVYLNEYKGKDGNQYASLACHANGIKIITVPKKNGATQQNTARKQVTNGQPASAVTNPQTNDDLPF
jgi:single-strand DNA-binding protein